MLPESAGQFFGGISHTSLFIPMDNLADVLFFMNVLKRNVNKNKAVYTATLVTCGWAGAVLEKVTWASGQELYAQKAQKR